MAYTKIVRPYVKDQPVDDEASQKEYLDRQFQAIMINLKTLGDAVAEIKAKLAAASVLPIT